ncbi:transketolase-like TK C-terminal-containing protein, partial [Aliarcobacter butzleri]
VKDGVERMYGEKQEDVFYYITTLNQNYVQPAMPEGAEEGIIKGIYKVKTFEAKNDFKVKLLGSGSIFQEAIRAAEILSSEYDIKIDIYSVTSYNELTREAQDIERENLLNLDKEAKIPYIEKVLGSNNDNIVISATDYMKSYSEQLRPYVKGSFKALGTDGFGRSDSRANLRKFFEVDTNFIVYTTLAELARNGKLDKKVALEAMKKYEIDSNRINPRNA